MEAMLVVLLLSGFVAALAGIVVIGRHSAAHPSFVSHPLHGHTIPFQRRTVFFSKAERSFYQSLRTLVPDHMIFTKVKLADLVPLSAHHSFWDHFSPVNRTHIDFVVCDATCAPVLAIELDDLGDCRPDHSGSDLVSTVLATASLPLVHLPSRPRYVFSELRRSLAPYLPVPGPLL